MKKSFTLVEMLVVIAIIGILSATVIVGTSTSRVRARDTRRIADLDAIKKAVLLYGDMRGNYKITYKTGDLKTNKQDVGDGFGSWGWLNCGGLGAGTGYEGRSVAEGLASWDVIGLVPKDVGTTCNLTTYSGYVYGRVGGDTSKFCLYAKLESKSGTGNWDIRGLTSVNADSEWWRTTYGVNYAIGTGCQK